MLRLGALAAALTALAACAGAPKGSCEALSEQYPGARVYSACEVTTKAQAPTNLRRVAFTREGVMPSCVTATIDVVIDSTGRPMMTTARTVKTNDSLYARVALRELDGATFVAATKDGRAVAQMTRLEFATKTDAGRVPFAVRRLEGPPPPSTPSRC